MHQFRHLALGVAAALAGCASRSSPSVSGGIDGQAVDAGSSEAGRDAAPFPFQDRFITRGYPSFQFVPCESAEQCPKGQTCFRLSEEIGVCDAPQPTVATVCSPLPDPDPSNPGDECGCAGRTCAAGQVCVGIEKTCSCPNAITNRCLEAACSAPSDCAVGTVCTPSSFIAGGSCIPASCRSDGDCPPGARCGVYVVFPEQAGEPFVQNVSCFVPTERP